MWNQGLFGKMAGTVVMLSLVGPAVAGSGHKHKGHKELSAHQHGHGSLNVAVEGGLLQIELEAPGQDIVGFESKPSSPKQKKAVAEGLAKLKDAGKLFSLSADAKCALKSADAELELEGKHSAFHAKYSFECAAPEALSKLGTSYFKQFARAEELDVQLITGSGQKKLELNGSRSSFTLR